jgi:hypothetical protein
MLFGVFFSRSFFAAEEVVSDAVESRNKTAHSSAEVKVHSAAIV